MNNPNNEKKCDGGCHEGALLQQDETEKGYKEPRFHCICPCHTQKPCCVKCFDDHGNGIVKKGVLGRCKNPDCPCHIKKCCCVKCGFIDVHDEYSHLLCGNRNCPDNKLRSDNPAQEEPIILSRAYVPRIEMPIQEKRDVLIQIRKHKCEAWNDDNDMQEGTAWGVIIDAAPDDTGGWDIAE